MSIRCLQDSAPGFVADKTFQCRKSFFARHPHFSTGAQRLARSKFQGHPAASSSPVASWVAFRGHERPWCEFRRSLAGVRCKQRVAPVCVHRLRWWQAGAARDEALRVHFWCTCLLQRGTKLNCTGPEKCFPRAHQIKLFRSRKVFFHGWAWKNFSGVRKFFFSRPLFPITRKHYSNSVPAKHIEQSLLVAHGPSPLEAVSGPLLLKASLDTFLTKEGQYFGGASYQRCSSLFLGPQTEAVSTGFSPLQRIFQLSLIPWTGAQNDDSCFH